jgi:hypothetical protein
MCLSYATVPPQYIIASKAHYLLVSLTDFQQEIVIGPALMACMHISLYPELKVELVTAGILPLLLKILIKSNSQPILTQACKLCASLSIYPPNKSQMALSGIFHALFDLVGNVHKVNVLNIFISYSLHDIYAYIFYTFRSWPSL